MLNSAVLFYFSHFKAMLDKAPIKAQHYIKFYSFPNEGHECRTIGVQRYNLATDFNPVNNGFIKSHLQLH